MNFGRLLTAMVTPFDEEMKVDYKRAAELALHLIDNGNDGIVVAGTTGESPTLSTEEKLELFRVVKEAVGDRAIVIAGTGSNSTSSSIELTKKAEKIGVDGVMLVVPYYNKPSQEGMYEHFKVIAESTSLPILLYNVPGRTSSHLQGATVAKLAQIDNIVAIKEASGDIDYITSLRTILPEEFAIYSGDDALTVPILAAGGHGIISVAGHIIGNEIQEMVKAFFDGDVTKATALHLKYYPFFKSMFITANPVPVKTALNLLDIPVGNVRLPLVKANQAEVDHIDQALISIEKK